jgi:hypothetical protein
VNGKGKMNSPLSMQTSPVELSELPSTIYFAGHSVTQEFPNKNLFEISGLQDEQLSTARVHDRHGETHGTQ